MSGLGSEQCCGNCLVISHLSYQYDIRVFSQGTADRRRKIGNIFANFSLMDQGLFTLIHVLDRIFDGDDMAVAVLVHMLDHSCKGG